MVFIVICTSIDERMAMVWDISRPFIPASMFIEFVQKVLKEPRYM